MTIAVENRLKLHPAFVDCFNLSAGDFYVLKEIKMTNAGLECLELRGKPPWTESGRAQYFQTVDRKSSKNRSLGRSLQMFHPRSDPSSSLDPIQGQVLVQLCFENIDPDPAFNPGSGV